MPDERSNLDLQIRLPYASKIETYVEVEKQGMLTEDKAPVNLICRADGTVGWEYA